MRKTPTSSTGEVRSPALPEEDELAEARSIFHACAEPRPPRKRKRRPIRRQKRTAAPLALVVPWNELPPGVVATTELWSALERQGIELSRAGLARLKKAGTIAPHPRLRVATAGRPADAWHLDSTVEAIRRWKGSL